MHDSRFYIPDSLSLALGPDLQGPRLNPLASNLLAIRYKPAEAWNMGQDS